MSVTNIKKPFETEIEGTTEIKEPGTVTVTSAPTPQP